MKKAPKNPMANTALNHKADVNVDVELSKLDNEKFYRSVQGGRSNWMVLLFLIIAILCLCIACSRYDA